MALAITHRKRAYSWIFLVLFTAVCVLFLSNQTLAKKNEQKLEISGQHKQGVLLQGFSPETEIYYTILSSAGLITEGRTETNREGDLLIEYKTPEITDHTYHVYDFKIARDGNYANILVRHNLQTGKISMTGNGLEQFSEVALIMPNKQSKTKTDWAGALFEEEVFKPHEDDNSYEIALYGFSNMGDLGRQQSHAIIKVLSAPGGGLYSDTPNTFTATTGTAYPLSTSNAGNITATINLIRQNYIRAFMLMTEQLSAAVMQQTLSIGQFFDAKMQLEVQRTHQELKAEAVKDYHPSEQMCRMGSYVRSLARTEQKAMADHYALNDAMMERYKMQDNHDNSQAMAADSDIFGRLKQFREIYCNPKDNNNALGYMCEHDQNKQITGDTNIGGTPGTATFGATTVVTTRFNKDVDYTRTMDYPQTLDMDMNDGTFADDEEDVLALAKNLYWPTPMEYGAEGKELSEQGTAYLDAQRVIALKNMAHNSYTNLASLKARAATPAAGVEPGWTFMKTLMRDFGIGDDEIEQLIGVEPSYWAQMEVLTKKIYQLPNFYTNLYDKPANVDRIDATLDAIKLMQMRDYYKSVQRREMLNSAMLETELINGNHYSRARSGTLFRQAN